MASVPCFSPAVQSSTALDLPDSEDDDEESAARDAGGGGRGGELQDLSTTPSSDSGSSSLEARRTPPRVLKRSLRAELLERWPACTSPARKRFRTASPDTASQPGSASSASGVSLASSSPATCTPSTGACDRFWRLVETIAIQPGLLERDRAEDCERLCVEEVKEAVPASDSPHHIPGPSPQRSPRQSPEPSPPLSTRDGQSHGPGPRRRPSPLPRRKQDPSVRQLAAPLSTWVGDDPTLLQTVILAVADDQDDDWECGTPLTPPPRASPVTMEDAVEGGAPPVDAVHSQDQQGVHCVQRPPRDELLERLQLLAGQACGSGGDPDKLDVEEDSSVLQLLVLTPTEERKFGDAPRRCVATARSLARQTTAATTSKYKTALGVLLRLRVPFFIIALGIVQVALFAAPSQYVAQEMKNKFVWDKARLFREPWRAMSYAMLHSGQMHVGLNVGVQSFVGAPLEREQSALRVAAVFFGGAVYGALVTGVVSPTLHMVGASAGIYAILMSHLAQILLNCGSVRYPKTRAGAVLLLTGADMAYTAHHAIQRGNAAPRIGVTAHCAGALSGVFLGLAFYRTATAAPSTLTHSAYSCCGGHRRALLTSLRACSGITLAAGVLFCLVWIYLDKPGEGLGLSF